MAFRPSPPAQNPQAGVKLFNLPQGYVFVITPQNQFKKVVDASNRLTNIVSLPQNDVEALAGFGFSGPVVVPNQYANNDGLQFNGATPTGLHTNSVTIPGGAPQQCTVMAVVSSADAQAVVFSSSDTKPLAFQVGNAGASTYVCFDDNLGNKVTYPACDLRGLTVLTWRATLGAVTAPSFRINGAEQALTGTTPTAPDGAAGASFANWFATGGRGLTGALEAIALWSTRLSDADAAAAEQLLVQMFGTIRHPAFLSDNGSILIQQADTNYGAAYASTIVQTSAPSLQAVYTATGGVSSQPIVVVDGVLFKTFDIASDNQTHTENILLDGNEHTVEFWDSAQIDTTPRTVVGSLRELHGAYTLVPTINSNTRLSVYGNSLTQAAYAGFVTPGGTLGVAGWWQLIRFDSTFPGRVSNIGSGGRSLHSDFAMDATMALLAGWLVSQAREVVAGNRKTIWYAGIELNDWQQAVWAPAAFGAALSALITQIHALDPDICIIMQSSVVALNQAAPNGLGFTLANYRSQVQTVANANSAFCYFLDGLSTNNGVLPLTVADLFDDVHPSGPGHIHYYNWAKVTPALQYSFVVPYESLIAWYRADQGIVPSGGNVGAWDSFGRSGDTGRNALGAGGTKPPLPTADGLLNGQLSLVFTQGGNGNLVTGAWSAAAMAPPITIYLVAHATNGANKFFFDSLPADVAGGQRVVLYDAALNLPTLRVNATDIPATVGTDGSSPHVYCLIIDPTLTEMYIDDMVTANASLASAPNVTPTGWTLGNDSTANFAVGGGFAEHMTYRGRHTPTQRATVAAYLKARYGTP